MFCCCTEEPAEESATQKSKRAAQSNTQAAKGTVSAPNQATSGEAVVKTSSAGNNRGKSPVTEQPVAQSKPISSVNQPQKDLIKEKAEEQKPKSVEVSDIEVKVVETARKAAHSGVESAVKSANSLSAGKQIIDTSISKTVDPKAFISNMPNIEQLKSLNSEVDKLDKAIGEAETKSTWEAKSSVPKLANQLKGLTSQVLTTVSGSGNMADTALQAVVARLESIATRLETLASGSAGGQPAGGDSGVVSPYVLAYGDIISGPLAKYISLSTDIGGDVQKQAALVQEAFESQRNFLITASKSKQPDQNTLVELLKPSAAKIEAVQTFRDNNRNSQFFNHLSAISESIPALAWVTISPAPGPYVKEMLDASTFYTNRVLKDFREKDPRHVEWSRSWTATLTELQAYIKQFHTTGLSWNPQGGDAKSVQATAGTAAPPPPAGGAPPPPPPPGPPPPPDTSSKAGSDDSAGRAALFKEISKGEDVTKGLKKVSDDMKTHKNPGLRQGPAPFKPAAAPKPAASPKPAAKAQAAPSHPPVTELQGKKWVVEYHKGNKNIVLDNVDLKQTVYIYKCEDSVVKVVGKVNSIVVDSCKKLGIVFDDLVSSLEFVNCQSVQGQVTGKIPTLSIDKTDGCMMYLSPDSLNVEIVTAKSSEMNILVPVGNGDYKEFALPEQYKSTYDGKSIVTAPTDIA